MTYKGTTIDRGDRVTVHRAYFADAERPEFGNGRGVVTHLDAGMFGDGSPAINVTLDNGRRVWGHHASFERVSA